MFMWFIQLMIHIQMLNKIGFLQGWISFIPNVFSALAMAQARYVLYLITELYGQIPDQLQASRQSLSHHISSWPYQQKKGKSWWITSVKNPLSREGIFISIFVRKMYTIRQPKQNLWLGTLSSRSVAVSGLQDRWARNQTLQILLEYSTAVKSLMLSELGWLLADDSLPN